MVGFFRWASAMAFNAATDPFRKHEIIMKKGSFPERYGIANAGAIHGDGVMFLCGGSRTPQEKDEKAEEKEKAAEKDTMAAEIRRRKEEREAKAKAEEEAAIAAGTMKRKKKPKAPKARRRQAAAAAQAEVPVTKFSDVWCSRDGGERWECLCEESPWAPRSGHALLSLTPGASGAPPPGGAIKAKRRAQRASAPALFLMGGACDAQPGLPGELCDVWKSEDGGETWEELARKAAWGGRSLFGAAVHFGQLYVVGGVAAKCAMLQDTWRSPDGVEWQCMSEGVKVPWCGRASHCVVVADDTLFLLGGYDVEGTLYRDVWRSFDGKHWRHVCDAPWQARCMAAAVAHEKDIYVMGGWGAEGWEGALY